MRFTDIALVPFWWLMHFVSAVLESAEGRCGGRREVRGEHWRHAYIPWICMEIFWSFIFIILPALRSSDAQKTSSLILIDCSSSVVYSGTSSLVVEHMLGVWFWSHNAVDKETVNTSTASPAFCMSYCHFGNGSCFHGHSLHAYLLWYHCCFHQ